MARPILTEFKDRIAAVRAAKVRKTRLGLGTDLTPRELDTILPPIDCYRTRIRLARRTARDPNQRSSNDA